MHLFVSITLALLFALSTNGEDIGFWWWTWGSGASVPASTNIGIAFSGWVDPAKALSDSKAIMGRLPGTKYISLGGGNANGHWSSSALQTINAAINRGDFSGYGGLVYDIEEGDNGLSSLFQQSFQAAKSKGFKVLVTISHSAPYGFGDAGSLMQTFFGDRNVDILSPQLYTSGTEGQNDYTTSGGVGWAQYKNFHGAVVPSIVRASLYDSARTYFSQQGVTITGFIQWAN